jgi:hypothetical protein
MPGPNPKNNPARRNATSTRAHLSVVHDVQAPLLPKGRDWHWQTESWWRDIWASPMAPEFDDSDKHGLFALAMLVDDFWVADSASERAKLSAEIRLQRQCFGLTPIDRRRLQWEIDRGEEAEEKTRKRKSSTAPKAESGEPAADPRTAYLQAVQ